MAEEKDKGVVAIFRNHAELNRGKSEQMGRPIYDDVEIVELRFPGSRNMFVFPAAAFSHWEDDFVMGGQRKVTYAERFARQYQQFKAHDRQTKEGTPLDYLPFLTEGKRAELRALNIYTAEALAMVDGSELKNLGPGGRDLKIKAEEYLASSSGNARITQMQAELDAAMAKNMTLEQDIEELRKRNNDRSTAYDNMTDQQLRDHVVSLTGVELKGNVSRRTLIRMADEHKVTEAA